MLRTAALVALIFASLACAPAQAQGNWYGGVSLGSAEANQIGFEQIDDGSALTGSIDENDFGWKLFAGYSYNRHVAIEFAYADLGQIQLSATSDGNGSLYDPGDVIARIDAQGFSLAVVGSMPAGERFDITAKVGYFVWKSKTSLFNPAVGTLSQDDDGSDPMIGIGARFKFSDRISLRGEYEHFSDIDDEDGSLLSLGFAYSF